MKTYIGTRIVKMEPMTREEYNTFRGWSIPEDEDGADEGYLVEYTDGGKPNVSGRDGYISWSPKEQADNAYREIHGLTFGYAIEALKNGLKVARPGWNGKGMFLFLVPGSQFRVNRAPLNTIYPEGTEINYRPHIDIKNVDGTVSTWAPSIGDALAEDWEIVE